MELRVGCIQVTSGPSLQDNVEIASRLVGEAALKGAKFVFLPEKHSLKHYGITQIIESPK